MGRSRDGLVQGPVPAGADQKIVVRRPLLDDAGAAAGAGGQENRDLVAALVENADDVRQGLVDLPLSGVGIDQ